VRWYWVNPLKPQIRPAVRRRLHARDHVHRESLVLARPREPRTQLTQLGDLRGPQQAADRRPGVDRPLERPSTELSQCPGTGLVTTQHRLPDDRLSGTGQGLVRTELRVGDAGGGQGSHRLDVRDYLLGLVLVDIRERRQVFWPEDWFHHDRPLSSLTVGLAATGPRLGPGRRLLLGDEFPPGTEATDNRLVGGDRHPRPLVDRLDR